jgi:hypothetical protein
LPAESSGVGIPAKDKRWWKLGSTELERREKLRGVVRAIIKAQVFRKEADLRHARLYANLPILGFGVASYSRPMIMTGNRLAYNVIKSCSDAFTAKLTKDRPKVTFLTSGGDEVLQQKAKNLDSFVEGQFYESHLYDTLPQVVLDACIFGTGVLKVYADIQYGEEGEADEKDERSVADYTQEERDAPPEDTSPSKARKASIVMERIFPWEIVIDDQEAMYGAPRAIYHRKYMDRLVVMELVKQWGVEDAEELQVLIESTRRDQDDIDGMGYDSTADQILVTEAWHLPSGPYARDGRHTIVVENATLLDEEYRQDYFPFVFFKRQRPPIGFWGIGLAEELIGIQLEINVLLQKIQRSHHLLAAGHWLVSNGCKINPGKIDNDIGSIIRFTGTPPELKVGQAVSPEVYEHLETLYHKAFDVSGISELTAQSEKPPGLNSGKALSTYANIETERFSVSVHSLHEFVLEVAKQCIDRAREIVKDYPDFEVRAHQHSVMRTLRFLDVDLRDEDRVMKMYPTNLLAKDPAERLAQIQELSGFLPPDDIRRLLDFPDIQAVDDYANASYELVKSIIEEFKDMAREPEYIGPEPYMDLLDGTKRMQLAYLVAKKNRLPEERLQLFRDWIQDAHAILNPPAPPPPAPVPGAPLMGGPPTMGAPPPPSTTMPAPAGLALGGPPPPPGMPPGPPPMPPPPPGPGPAPLG